ncbi:MAG: putative LPS assembly protein LptD [Bacteroidetes bacterium]|nr:putative LPS assembly protein LptD [Bacteroidota bacterium]MDF1866630.1 putative LPS assembly protein LptD [Saprospiraceae bacterium]
MKTKLQIIISFILFSTGFITAKTTTDFANHSGWEILGSDIMWRGSLALSYPFEDVKVAETLDLRLSFDGQTFYTNTDTIPEPQDSVTFLTDSLFNATISNKKLLKKPVLSKNDTISSDTIPKNPFPQEGFDSRNLPTGNNADLPVGNGGAGAGNSNANLSKIKISNEAVDKEVSYESVDSMYFDIKNKQIHLDGQALVTYQSMTINSEKMVIDWNDNTILAEGRKILGKTIGAPQFKEGEQVFGSSKMKYNFKTEKGIIYDAASEQEGMQVRGKVAKYISAADSTQNDVIYNKGAIFTTCQHSEPHFGVRSRKQKVVPDKVAVVGPSNIEIMGIPTPLVLPFGFFPLKQGKRTGLIFPRNYEFSEAFGFGLNTIGWYFPINDQWDLQLTGDIYFKGTFRIHAASRYKKRYKYNGNLNLDVAYLRNETSTGELEYSPSFGVRWTHNQDSKAHPTQTFRGSLNIQTNGYQQQNQFDAQSQFQSSLSSNVSMSWREVGPLTLSTSFRHSQNTSNSQVKIQFPNLNIQARTMYPFKRKNKTGPAKWFEEVSLDYNGEFRNEFTATDSTLFTAATLDDAKFGMRHNLSSRVNFNILKYFNLSPNVSYKEVWYMKTTEKIFSDIVETQLDTIYNPLDSTDFDVTIDTTKAGEIISRENFGFEAFREYTVGVSLRTKIFGTLLLKKGPLRGLRHVITPSVGFNFSPNYNDPSLGYYREVQENLEGTEFETYSIFENGIFGRPSSSGRRMSLDFGFTNDFDAKIYSKKDSTDKKINIFRGFSIRSSYNFAADSLKFSQVRMNGSTALFNRMTTVAINLLYDPYAPADLNDPSSKRIDTYWYDLTGKPLRFVQGSVNLSTGLTIKRIRDFFKGVNSDNLANPGGNQTGFGQVPGSGSPRGAGGSIERKDGLLDMFESTSIRHNLRFNWDPDTLELSAHTVSITAGRIPITDNWNVRIGNIGYDFARDRLTYPDFTFSRDLHCWEMGVSWRPEVSVYSFYLRVKPGKLDFINIPYGQNQPASFGRF